jgi:hypothetical protein
LVNDMLGALGQLELGGRDDMGLFDVRHRVVEQGRLVGKLLYTSASFRVRTERGSVIHFVNSH